jgi:hypothetical protein
MRSCGVVPVHADVGFYGVYDINPPVGCTDFDSVHPHTSEIYVIYAIKPAVRSRRNRATTLRSEPHPKPGCTQ